MALLINNKNIMLVESVNSTTLGNNSTMLIINSGADKTKFEDIKNKITAEYLIKTTEKNSSFDPEKKIEILVEEDSKQAITIGLPIEKVAGLLQSSGLISFREELNVLLKNDPQIRVR